MTAPTGSFDSVTVELSAAEAQSGVPKTFVVPPGDRTVTVQIPPGVADNSVFRLPGAGAPDPESGVPRDVVVNIRVVPVPGAAPYPGMPAFGPPPVAPVAAPTRNRTMLLVAGALAVVLVLGCIGLGALFVSRGGDDKKPQGAAGTSTPSAPGDGAPAAAVPPADYQAALATVDKNLAATVTRLRAAKSPKAIEAAAGALARAARAEETRLAALTPPSTAGTGHTSLVDALGDLATAAEDTGAAASGRQVCAGSSAAALFSRAAAMERLRAAAKELAGADPTFKVATFVPAKTKDTNRRLGTGTYLKRSRGGSGEFQIANGSGDKVVSLVRKGKPTITVYVRSKGKHTVFGVPDGSYKVYVTGGVDYDKGQRRFTRNCSFSQFDAPLRFRTTAATFTIWKITLKPVSGGNASSSEVDPDNFPG